MRKSDGIANEKYAWFISLCPKTGTTDLAVKQFSIEGQLELRALLFAPRRAPSNFLRVQEKAQQHQAVRSSSSPFVSSFLEGSAEAWNAMVHTSGCRG